MNKTLVKAYTVYYEDNARQGIAYLRDDLDSTEAEVFFYHARIKGSAQFEDDADRQFTLEYKSNKYTLIRR